MAETDKTTLLAKFKLAIGDMTPGTELDDYYGEKLATAQEMLAANDISQEVLESDLGMAAIVLWAKCLMNGENIAENKTLASAKHAFCADEGRALRRRRC